jgi:hypothetical protein
MEEERIMHTNGRRNRSEFINKDKQYNAQKKTYKLIYITLQRKLRNGQHKPQ